MEGRDSELLTAHLEETLRRFPGPPYDQVLAVIHAHLRPSNYVEIGVDKGLSLVRALPQTRSIGIEPEPRIEVDLPNATIYELTSDEFFARHDLKELLGEPVALAFIDGLHLFEQVLVDFINVERHSDSGTVVVLHDCLPLDEETQSRERTTLFYSGDVWKATMALHRHRPDLEMAIVPAMPTGMCLVRGLDPGNGSLERDLAAIVREYEGMGYEDYLARESGMPDRIPNSVAAVQAWLDGPSGG
jgi:hypothetical protein